MSNFSQIMSALLLGGLAFYMFLQARKQPQMFEKAKMLKSLHTFAVLALILIAFVWLCVAFLRSMS